MDIYKFKNEKSNNYLAIYTLNSFSLMIDIGLPETLSFTTQSIFYRNIYGSDLVKKFSVTPSWSPIWNYKALAIFLNEMQDFEPVSKKPTRNYKSESESYRIFKFQHKKHGEKYLLYVYIRPEKNFSIEVLISRDMMISDYFKQISERKNLFHFDLVFSNFKNSSQSLIHSESLAFFDINDFSDSFIYFTRIITLKISENRFTSFLFEFSEIYFKRPNSRSISNLKQLKAITQGYLKILTVKQPIPKLFKLYDDQDCYVLRGCYVSPFGQSILNQTALIDGLMIDGTFKVLKNYVTCIVMCIVRNTGIPVGFSFSTIEDVELYDLVFETFLEITGVDLTQFVIESDEGKCLMKSLTAHNCKHLSCLRHLLANVQKKKYGYEVSKLVCCRCSKDFETLSGQFNSIFNDISKASDLNALEETLNYVGLTFQNKEIDFFDLQRWSEVSMIQRSQYNMPSTTNTIESTHGHLNEITPRRNCFFTSIYRLIMSIMSQIHNFNMKMHHNYRQVICDVKKTKAKELHFEEKCHFYTTKLHSCNCGETVLYTNMFKVDVPCSHRLYLGALFPDIKDIIFNLQNQFNELILDVREDVKATKKIEYDTFKTIAVKNIKKFSHVKKKKKEIEEFFDMNYKPAYEKFALGYPIELFVVISNGIEKFSSQ